MLNPANITATAAAHTSRQDAVQNRAVFRMLTSDRMAGSVPAWVPADSAQDQSLAALSNTQSHMEVTANFANDLSAYNEQHATETINDEPFGFGDLIDIINPLQHIPVISTVYRAITGDSIRSSSDIVGGAVYGGIMGAATGLVDLVVKHETGKNIAQHALALVSGEDSTPSAARVGGTSISSAPEAPLAGTNNLQTTNEGHNTVSPIIEKDHPIERLAKAQDIYSAPAAIENLPGNLLSFVELGNRPVKPLPAQASRYADVYRFNT